jgi:hypothetical protein
MSQSGDDGDRPRRSWSEIDRLRDKGRSHEERRPRDRHSEARSRQAAERYVKEIDSLFTSADGGQEGAALAQAVRDAHGSAELPEACRVYRERFGYPKDLELISLFLDTSDESLVVGTLEALLAAVEAGGAEPGAGLRSQLGVLAEDFNDAIASVAEDIVTAL